MESSMAKSLAKLKEQIAKLQKEADAIQSDVIARIKREIAQHGLTAEHLFGSTRSTFIGDGNRAAPATKGPKAKKAGAAKAAKYADGQGNSWHGIGKRPGWIHAALAAGHSLSDFLVGASPVAATSKPAASPAKAAAKPVKKVMARKKPAPAKKAAKAEKAPVAAKRVMKVPAKKAVKSSPAKKATKAKAPPQAEAAQTTA